MSKLMARLDAIAAKYGAASIFAALASCLNARLNAIAAKYGAADIGSALASCLTAAKYTVNIDAPPAAPAFTEIPVKPFYDIPPISAKFNANGSVAFFTGRFYGYDYEQCTGYRLSREQLLEILEDHGLNFNQSFYLLDNAVYFGTVTADNIIPLSGNNLIRWSNADTSKKNYELKLLSECAKKNRNVSYADRLARYTTKSGRWIFIPDFALDAGIGKPVQVFLNATLNQVGVVNGIICVESTCKSKGEFVNTQLAGIIEKFSPAPNDDTPADNTPADPVDNPPPVTPTPADESLFTQCEVDRERANYETWTPLGTVQEMLATPEMQDAINNADQKFVDPCAGSGNISMEILRQKLNRHALNGDADKMLAILSTIYGIELMQDNVARCRQNLLTVFANHYRHVNGAELPQDIFNAAAAIVERQIIQGDCLPPTGDDTPAADNPAPADTAPKREIVSIRPAPHGNKRWLKKKPTKAQLDAITADTEDFLRTPIDVVKIIGSHLGHVNTHADYKGCSRWVDTPYGEFDVYHTGDAASRHLDSTALKADFDCQFLTLITALNVPFNPDWLPMRHINCAIEGSQAVNVSVSDFVKLSWAFYKIIERAKDYLRERYSTIAFALSWIDDDDDSTVKFMESATYHLALRDTEYSAAKYFYEESLQIVNAINRITAQIDGLDEESLKTVATISRITARINELDAASDCDRRCL